MRSSEAIMGDTKMLDANAATTVLNTMNLVRELIINMVIIIFIIIIIIINYLSL